MSASEESLTLLRSIDASLKALVARQAPATAAPSNGAEVASDADLDGQWGNPEVKARDPRDWTGPTMKGRKLSECPAEYLDMLAERNDYFAQQADEKGEMLDNGKPVSHYKRLDAARCRGWAARIRAGRVKQAAVAEPGFVEADDVQF